MITQKILISYHTRVWPECLNLLSPFIIFRFDSVSSFRCLPYVSTGLFCARSVNRVSSSGVWLRWHLECNILAVCLQFPRIFIAIIWIYLWIIYSISVAADLAKTLRGSGIPIWASSRCIYARMPSGDATRIPLFELHGPGERPACSTLALCRIVCVINCFVSIAAVPGVGIATHTRTHTRT